MAKKYRILIIDDSEETLIGLEAFLGEKYHILKASNGKDGIIQFEKNIRRIHLILTDLILPDYIGESLISLFKRLAPEKPVVAMTGWDYNYEKAEPKLNADLLLIKPFEMEELDHAIKKLLSKKHIKKVKSKFTFKEPKELTRYPTTPSLS